jgi:hypothetical protein
MKKYIHPISNVTNIIFKDKTSFLISWIFYRKKLKIYNHQLLRLLKESKSAKDRNRDLQKRIVLWKIKKPVRFKNIILKNTHVEGPI